MADFNMLKLRTKADSSGGTILEAFKGLPASYTISEDQSVGSQRDRRLLTAIGTTGSYVHGGMDLSLPMRDDNDHSDDGNIHTTTMPLGLPDEMVERSKKALQQRKPGSESYLSSYYQDFFSTSNTSPLVSKEDLQLTLKRLITENISLRQQFKEPLPPRYQVIYKLGYKDDSRMYLDHPRLMKSEDGYFLSCSEPLENLSLYLERNKDVSFLVFKDFESSMKQNPDLGEASPSAFMKPVKESIKVIAPNLRTAIKCLLSTPQMSSMFANYFNFHHIEAPYLFIFHSRKWYETRELDEMTAKHFLLLQKYVIMEYGKDYELADILIAKGRITWDSLAYIFHPNELVLSSDQEHNSVHMLQEWPVFNKPKIDAESDPYSETHLELPAQSNHYLGQGHKTRYYSFRTFSWSFEGSFRRQDKILTLHRPEQALSELCIADLKVFPIRFASPEMRQKLLNRGLTLWKCRFGQVVAYDSSRDTNDSSEDDADRYMVDMKAYKKLHSAYSDPQDDLGPEKMNASEPPGDDFLLMLPAEIKGFHLRSKKWHDLQIADIKDVSWNKKIFDNLVLPPKTKKVIRALVSRQVVGQKSTDFVQGKGNGLILLLHGGPGTGKTLTAEAIAELVEKPLYRVTCGDLGTDPEKVEQYLESVFHLGKIWNCVVLLDEADVFLQERNLNDLQRNALVAVFLRVLEYHEGILFLTSNRIGTFDEAFKSRIQLSLHYKPLAVEDRRKVWRNFITRLEDIEKQGTIDLDDLKDNLDKLAGVELNGRQIRNSITIARQIAQYDNQPLGYEHLENVIELAEDFEKYVNMVNDDMTDEDRMRELQVR